MADWFSQNGFRPSLPTTQPSAPANFGAPSSGGTLSGDVLGLPPGGGPYSSINDPPIHDPAAIQQWQQQNAPGTPNWQRLMGGNQSPIASTLPVGTPVRYGMPPQIAQYLQGQSPRGWGLPPAQPRASTSMYGGSPTLANLGGPAMVTMQAPDGTIQQVPEDHVPHYQSLGAQPYSSSYRMGG